MENEDQGVKEGAWSHKLGVSVLAGRLTRTGGIPVWMPHLQKRLFSEKPVAPMICPITCTSAMALGEGKIQSQPCEVRILFPSGR
jgi:hypothetical protein